MAPARSLRAASPTPTQSCEFWLAESCSTHSAPAMSGARVRREGPRRIAGSGLCTHSYVARPIDRMAPGDNSLGCSSPSPQTHNSAPPAAGRSQPFLKAAVLKTAAVGPGTKNGLGAQARSRGAARGAAYTIPLWEDGLGRAPYTRGSQTWITSQQAQAGPTWTHPGIPKIHVRESALSTEAQRSEDSQVASQRDSGFLRPAKEVQGWGWHSHHHDLHGAPATMRCAQIDTWCHPHETQTRAEPPRDQHMASLHRDTCHVTWTPAPPQGPAGHFPSTHLELSPRR